MEDKGEVTDMKRRELLGMLGFAAVAPYACKLGFVEAATKRQFATVGSFGNVLKRIDSIFEPIHMSDATIPEFPTDLFASSMEVTKYPYHMPNHGYKARTAKIRRDSEHGTEYIAVPDYEIGQSVDWVKGADLGGIEPLKMMEDSFVKKVTDDQWHLILAAGIDRNIIVQNNKQAGMNEHLVQMMKEVAGHKQIFEQGPIELFERMNSNLTDLYIGEDVWDKHRNGTNSVYKEHGVTSYDSSGRLKEMCDVKIHPLAELDKDHHNKKYPYDGGEYSCFYRNELQGTLPTDRSRLVVGLCRPRNCDKFVMPMWDYNVIREPDFKDGNGKRRHFLRLVSKLGMAVMDNKVVVLGAI